MGLYEVPLSVLGFGIDYVSQLPCEVLCFC